MGFYHGGEPMRAYSWELQGLERGGGGTLPAHKPIQPSCIVTLGETSKSLQIYILAMDLVYFSNPIHFPFVS